MFIYPTEAVNVAIIISDIRVNGDKGRKSHLGTKNNENRLKWMNLWDS